ncbi:MAG: T9SS type A sorting domain-containing protein [Lewinellaceae bacterium]|jgi:hypothetical protein|nr:T9SS type A sorting domain-containing protein [Lewinellaceae bacterium]
MKVLFTAGMFCWLLSSFPAYCQSGDICRAVVGAAGNSAQYQDWTIEYTVGEPAILTLESASAGKTVTQGFHQPEECISVSTFGPEGAEPFTATLYPNPTTGRLYLSFDPVYVPEMDAQVLDLTGRICSPAITVRAATLNELDFSDLPSGYYLLTLRRSGDDRLISIPFVRTQ